MASSSGDRFFDNRFPGSMRLQGSALEDETKSFKENMELTRSRARQAIEVARNISEAGTAEEERRLMREQIEAQIKAGFGGATLRRSSMVRRA